MQRDDDDWIAYAGAPGYAVTLRSRTGTVGAECPIEGLKLVCLCTCILTEQGLINDFHHHLKEFGPVVLPIWKIQQQ